MDDKSICRILGQLVPSLEPEVFYGERNLAVLREAFAPFEEGGEAYKELVDALCATAERVCGEPHYNEDPKEHLLHFEDVFEAEREKLKTLRARAQAVVDDAKMSEDLKTYSVTESLVYVLSGVLATLDAPSAPSLHPATAGLVHRFSRVLAEKLAAAEAKYGYSDGWAKGDWENECRAKLMEHIMKGDPRDVAAYCAFMWHHGWRTWRTESSGLGRLESNAFQRMAEVLANGLAKGGD